MVVPYYIQVAETIRGRILSGQYGRGDLIPSSKELEKEFNFSAITIRKALESLAQEGFIQRKQGKGTIVSRSKTDVITFELSGSFQRHVDALGRIPFEVDVLEITTLPCPTQIQPILCIPAHHNVFKVRKVRKHQGTPVAYYIHYTAPALCRGIAKKDVERLNFPDVFRKKSAVTLARMEQTLKAAVADIDVSAVLNIKFGVPLFFMENVYISTEDKPAILTQIYYRGDMCSYRATLQL
jgi:DNA-binding GntR family transcriptional regulator